LVPIILGVVKEPKQLGNGVQWWWFSQILGHESGGEGEAVSGFKKKRKKTKKGKGKRGAREMKWGEHNSS